jgi:hypothetical protein
MASLFKKAKEDAPDKKINPKLQKVRVTVKEDGFFENVKRLAYVTTEMKSLKTEADILSDQIKEIGISEWAKLYQKSGVNPESIMIEAKENNNTAQYMLLMSDKYIIINQERADYLKETYGADIVTEKETYEFDAEMVEKHGETISDLIMGCDAIPAEDKERIIKAVVSNTVAKGTIDKLKIYADAAECSVADMIGVVKPVVSAKNIEYVAATAIYS